MNGNEFILQKQTAAQESAMSGTSRDIIDACV